MSDDINRLMSTDPLELTDTDVDSVIEYFRGIRHTFKETGKKPASKPKKVTEADSIIAKSDGGFSL